MAALQSIRKKGALLVGVLGLALFAFIAEEFFRSIETTSAINRSQVGEVYGEKLSIQDFQNLVDEQIEFRKLQKQMQGQEGTLTDSETDQIREQVWQQFVSSKIIEHEADKLGLFVTDGEVQEALRSGEAQALQMMAGIFPNQQTGKFDLAQLQAFLKDYDKTVAQAKQAQNAEAVEQLELIKNLWTYTEKQLRQELLNNKFNMLFAMGYISNPVSAKMSFEERAELVNAEIAAVPYSTIDDKEITVTDDDLKEAYKTYKTQFYSPAETRDIKLIDVAVVASAQDRAALMAKVQGLQEELAAGEDVAAVVRKSGSEVQYSDLAMSKKAFQRMYDIYKDLDSVAVGSVKATYYNASDNTINTYKLVSKIQAPDSILYRQIVSVAETPEKRKAQADSILTALKGGASFAELAKKYGQRTDSVWLTSAQYETFGLNDENAFYLNKLYTIPANSADIIANDQGAVVAQVLDRRNIVTKYKVAIVKCTLNFSKKTYENELSKFNRFLAENKTIEDIEKNAAKNTYVVTDLTGYSPMNNFIPQRIGGSQAKDAARWIFDEAEAGDVSRLYECGRSNDHLLVVLVKATNDKGYLPWDNADVKSFLTTVVKQQKKGALIAERLKAAKTLEDVMKQKGAIREALPNQTFAGYPQLMGVGTPEPILAGTIAKTAVGKCSAPVVGAGAVYMVKVTGKSKGAEKFDEASEVSRLGQTAGQRTYNSVFTYLMTKKAEIVDHRYQF